MALPVLSSSAVKFRRVLAHFPQELSLAFAYGSGVFRQAGAAAELGQDNMLDFVFAVDDSVTWHMMNLLKNRSHYSFLKLFGPKQITSVQSYGAGIYYNTLVPCNGRLIKYGVISTDTLIDDLFHWKTLYVAGRLQKPVKILTQNENSKLQAALVSNLKSAVTAAFLMLPESFSEEDLYMQIAGLSYSGDFRMIIGEDRSKVQNIVKPNIPHFQKLYSNILQDCPQVVYKHHLGRLEIDKSPEGQFTQLMALPKTLQQKITSLVNPPGKNRDVEEILLQVAHDPECGFVVHQGISGIVRSSSVVQSAKTILTAGNEEYQASLPGNFGRPTAKLLSYNTNTSKKLSFALQADVLRQKCQRSFREAVVGGAQCSAPCRQHMGRRMSLHVELLQEAGHSCLGVLLQNIIQQVYTARPEWNLPSWTYLTVDEKGLGRHNDWFGEDLQYSGAKKSVIYSMKKLYKMTKGWLRKTS